MNPFDSKIGKVHSELNERIKEFESLSSSQQLSAIYTELLKANYEYLLHKEELGVDEDLSEGHGANFEVILGGEHQLSIKEQVYALKSLGVFEYLKKERGVTIDESALLLSAMTGSSASNYRKLIALKKTEKLTPHSKEKKQKEVHKILWEKLFRLEHGKTLLPKIDPIAYDKWVDSEPVTDKLSGSQPK